MTHDEMIAVIQAHKEGKEIQFKNKSYGEWEFPSGSGPQWNFHTYDYRIKPTPKRVSLGPDDFPPGTAVSSPKAGTGYSIVTAVNDDHVHTSDAMWTFDELASHFHNIHRRLPGSTEWIPCWREE